MNPEEEEAASVTIDVLNPEEEKETAFVPIDVMSLK
jgi:hypothetical protein